MNVELEIIAKVHVILEKKEMGPAAYYDSSVRR